jgi:hypothetical protein
MHDDYAPFQSLTLMRILVARTLEVVLALLGFTVRETLGARTLYNLPIVVITISCGEYRLNCVPLRCFSHR